MQVARVAVSRRGGSGHRESWQGLGGLVLPMVGAPGESRQQGSRAPSALGSAALALPICFGDSWAPLVYPSSEVAPASLCLLSSPQCRGSPLSRLKKHSQECPWRSLSEAGETSPFLVSFWECLETFLIIIIFDCHWNLRGRDQRWS